jgi:hypothetical protein
VTQVERRGYNALSRVIGRRTTDRLAGFYRDRLLPASEGLTYSLSPRGRRSREALRALRDQYAGRRCVIIGNGPSLRDTDLSLLRNEYTFALNRGYMLFERIGGPSTFLVTVNQYVIEQFTEELMSVPSLKFASWRTRRLTADANDLILVRRSRRFSFASDVAEQGAWEGATVTYMAMQLAYHMGFTKVILIGVDHSFASKGPANKLVTAGAPDQNHFDPHYFGPGVKWELPDLEMSEVAYRLARDHFTADGREIVDATVGGNLSVFRKVDYVREMRDTTS